MRREASLSSVPARELSAWSMLFLAFPFPWLSFEVFCWRLRNLPHFLRGWWKVSLARLFKVPHIYGRVSHVKIKPNGDLIDFGLASLRVVTTVGVNYLVDAFQNLTEPENLKFHGFGTGATAEAVGDTALVTELTTQYATDNTRPTGSTTEGASANIYRTVATLSPDANVTITEHGIFSQAATGGGTLLDRSVFTGIALTGSADSLQTTYDLTLSAGG